MREARPRNGHAYAPRGRHAQGRERYDELAGSPARHDGRCGLIGVGVQSWSWREVGEILVRSQELEFRVGVGER